MKDKLLFIAKFLFFSTVLFVPWMFIGRFYLIFLAQVATPILHLMGYAVELVINDQIMFTYLGAEMWLTHAELTNYNIIPFIALVLATPITFRKMINNLLIGLPIIFIFHLINLLAHFPLYYDANEFANFITSTSAVTQMLIPFMLWFAVSYDYVLSSFRTRKKMYECPFCGKKTHGIMMHIHDKHYPLTESEKKRINILKTKHPELNNKT